VSERAICLWKRPGGYTYTQTIPCLVLDRTAERVRIRVMLQSGEMVERTIQPERVRPATPSNLEDHRKIYAALEHQGEADQP
jgi:hypothetical protein